MRFCHKLLFCSTFFVHRKNVFIILEKTVLVILFCFWNQFFVRHDCFKSVNNFFIISWCRYENFDFENVPVFFSSSKYSFFYLNFYDSLVKLAQFSQNMSYQLEVFFHRHVYYLGTTTFISFAHFLHCHAY